MSFNIGLSALNAAQEEISVTGNNIANASTNGFKSSRTEFADVYAASVLGGGVEQAGGGVAVQNIAQNFSQGNISFTDNTLDLAINGNGFFILSSGDGGTVYTRAGAFGTDINGNIVNSLGERLQGYAATSDGKAAGSGPLTDLVVTTGEISPQATTLVSSRINLDASAGPSSIVGSKVLSNAGASGAPQLGVRVAQSAVVGGKISTAGTDFSGTTAATTTGSSNVSNGLAFNTAGTPQGFSISVNGGAFAAIDLSGADEPDGAAVIAAVDAALVAKGFTAANNNAVNVTLVNNRVVLTTANTGDNARINITAVQGLASSVVSAVDVQGKTAPPTGFTVTLDGSSKAIVIDKNFTNSGAAALALGGGAGSGNEALEDYIQAQINTSASLLNKVTVSIDAAGKILFETTAATNQELTINPLTSTAGGINFDQVVTFSTGRREGTLDTTKLDFSAPGESEFKITVDGTSLTITLDDDYTAEGDPSKVLGQFTESGVEALEDYIQKEINASTLPGNVKVSIAADGKFVFDITDTAYTSLKVESSSVAASIAGTVNVNSGYDFTVDNYDFTITYDNGTGPVTSAAIILDQKYDSGQELVDAVQNKINTDINFGFLLGKEQVKASLDSATGKLVLKTVATGPDAELDVTLTTPAAPPYVLGDPGEVILGDGPAVDFATVATFSGSELNNTGKNAIGNGYSAETIEVLDNTGVKQLVTIEQGATANAVAQRFSNVSGITATASTVAYITASNSGDPENKGSETANVDPNLPLKFSINGFSFEASQANATDRYTELETQINASSGNLSARVVTDADGKSMLEVTENNGVNLVFSGGTNGRGSITVAASSRDPLTGEPQLATGVATQQLANLANISDDGVVVGGIVEFTLDEDVVMLDATTDAAGNAIATSNASIFGNISDAATLTGTPFELNTFDPLDADTYYRSTAVAIFDSVGIQHTMTQYFVKERPSSTDQSGSVWSVYFQIDGKDVGYDSGALDNQPSLAKATLRFTETGVFDPTQEPIYITNWTPLDSAGKQSGAGPVAGNTTVADSTSNSNFKIDLSDLTQYGGDFSVQSNKQNGFAKGQLTGLDINDSGAVFARFSNGQSKVLGEVALAKFGDQSQLANAGGTRFTETAGSGPGTASGAGTAGLGVIQSGALEDSNVELSEQLVQLIVSQRNFQAAAQIIEAADTTTQTIINL